MSLDDIDLTDPDAYVPGVPHEWFARLRAEAPVHWHPDPASTGGGFWAVTSYEHCTTVNRDWQTFSSMKGAVYLWDLPEAELEQQQMLMLNMDPPLHTRYRLLVNKGFTPRMVNALEQQMRERTREILDRVGERGECDFVVDVAAELPLQVIADLMGVPQEDRHKIFDWSNRMIGGEDPEYGLTEEDRAMASMELYAYSSELAASRKIDPHDDLISILTQAEVEGEKLSDLEIDLFFLLLSVAGNETTRNLISHGILALLDNPDQLARLRADRELMGPAIEEMLRWGTPVMNFRRTATRDTELGGQKIAEGDKVVFWHISANRDESVFENPYTFDIARSPNEHMAFGSGGPHYCLGANLARMEIRVMFEELLDRFTELERIGEAPRLRSSFINGIKHIPLRVA
ncbi:MAG: cytochrome P450 [Actinomycetota bacterium]